MHKNAIHRQHFASSNIQFLNNNNNNNKMNNNNNIFSNSNNNHDRNHHNYQSNRSFHKPKKMNKRAVIYFDKLNVREAKVKVINLLDELYNTSNDYMLYNDDNNGYHEKKNVNKNNRNKQNNKNKTINNINSNVFVIDKYNFLKKGIHLQFGTKHNKKIKDEDRHLLYLSIIELLDELDVIYNTKFGDRDVELNEFLNLEKDFWDSLYKIHVNKRVPTIFIPSHGLSRYNVNRSNEAMASILLYNTGIRYFGLLSVITTVTYIIPKIQGYML